MIQKTFGLLLEFGKKLKKLPKLLLQGPKLILAVLTRIGRKTAILPLTTFSGKMLFVTLYLLAITAGSGLLYYHDGGELVWTVFYHAGAGAAVSGVVFIISYPLDRWGYIEGFLVSSGIRQRMRISTRFGAVLGGLVIAIVVTVATEYIVWLSRGTGYGLFAIGSQRRFIWPEWELGAAFVVGFVLGTGILLLISRRKTRSLLSEDITIVEILEGEDREVILRNDGNSPISIIDAKIKDANGEIYALALDLRFRPGEKVSVKIPEAFELESESDDTSVEGFYQRHITSIYSHNGETYVITWEG